jgi:diguanylate cyclase (GGDEF)-like protein/PAS domain S-box-containing protein
MDINADTGAGADAGGAVSDSAPSPRHELALWGARLAAWDWDLTAERIAFCPRFHEMIGAAPHEDVGDPKVFLAHIHPDDLPGFQAALRLHLAGERAAVDCDLRLRRGLGEDVWVRVRGSATRDDLHRPIALVGVIGDITARKRTERQLAHGGLHDALTGLPTRPLLLDRIGLALARAHRPPGAGFAVAIIDLDRFKQINDALGARHGDEALKTVARRLDAERRTGDTLARLSADEFCFVLENINDPEEVAAFAARMSAQVARPIKLDGNTLELSCCVGVAIYESAYERSDDILRDAGLAVYRAKQAGRGRIDIFDRSLRLKAVANMRTEIDLRAALEHGQLCLHYQPIIALNEGRIAGFEALMRWRHPRRGMVPPLDFIPLAEETGLIVPMGRWALAEATRQIADWRKRFPRRDPLFMAVNVSFRQFSHDDLPERVREVLADADLDPNGLKLEITESLLMQDPIRARAIMEELREIGVGLSIDDFGTGYSSLSYLHKLPAHTLKIDKGFVQAISSGESNAAIVQVIATLAAILRMDVVAEGVEQPEEAQFLRDVMCRYAQGYHFARPLPADEVEKLMIREIHAPEPLFKCAAAAI